MHRTFDYRVGAARAARLKSAVAIRARVEYGSWRIKTGR